MVYLKSFMSLRVEEEVPKAAIDLLKHCYVFVTKDWQHLPREDTPDQGFEARLREHCITKLAGWSISQHREMNLGMGLLTASGVLHEVDVVTQRKPTVGILELKNRPANPPEKNDVIVFFSKILDYLCHTPALLNSHLVLTFVSSYAFDQSGLAACLGLGVHPVAPDMRPLPVLCDTARRMLREREKGCSLSPGDAVALEEFCAKLNKVVALLRETDANVRFDCFDDLTLAVRACDTVQVYELADDLRQLNAECSRLLRVFQRAVGERAA